MKNLTTGCLLILISFSLPQLILSQSIDLSNIDLDAGTKITGKMNGLNMGGYSYGQINNQGDQVSIKDECIECVDFDCSIFLEHGNITGPSFASMETKPNVVEQTRKLNPSVLRFPGGTHSGWYHYYKYTDGMYDASAPVVAKGYGMTLGETIHLPNPYKYCQADTRLLVDQNYIDGFINYVKNIQENSAHRVAVSYVANLFTHYRFQEVGLPLILPCTYTCGKSITFEPMTNYDCTATFTLAYEGNEDLFDNNPNVYRFELAYKETQDAVEYLITELGLTSDDVFYVEMGNEYYANEGFNSGYSNAKYLMTAESYAKLSEIYSERLKCYFEGQVNLKTGFVSKPNSNWESTPNMTNVNYPGLSNLLNEDFTSNGTTLGSTIDGVILHAYYAKNHCLELENIDERFECAKGALDQYVTSNDDGLLKDLNTLRTRFPNQKVWLTEWSIVAGLEQQNVSYLNTPLFAAFVLEYALSLTEYNTQFSEAVEMATHHRVGEEQPWSVIQIKSGDNDFALMRANGYVMKYLEPLFQNKESFFLGNLLNDNGADVPTDEARSFAFLQKDFNNSADRLLIYFSNKEDKNIELTIPETIGNQNIQNAKLRYIKGNHLFSYGDSNGTNGQNKYVTPGSIIKDSELDQLGFGPLHNTLEEIELPEINAGSSEIIPPYSVGVLEIIIGEIDATEDVFQVSSFSVHPNPSQDIFNVNFEESSVQQSQLAVFDTKGNRILSQEIPKNTKEHNIDLIDFPSGVYFMQIMVNGDAHYKKLIKL